MTQNFPNECKILINKLSLKDQNTLNKHFETAAAEKIAVSFLFFEIAVFIFIFLRIMVNHIINHHFSIPK